MLTSKGSAKPVPSALNISLRNSNSACVVVLAARLWLDEGPAVDFCPVVDRSLGGALGKEGAAMEPDRDLDTGIVVESDRGRPPEAPKESQFDLALSTVDENAACGAGDGSVSVRCESMMRPRLWASAPSAPGIPPMKTPLSPQLDLASCFKASPIRLRSALLTSSSA